MQPLIGRALGRNPNLWSSLTDDTEHGNLSLQPATIANATTVQPTRYPNVEDMEEIIVWVADLGRSRFFQFDPREDYPCNYRPRPRSEHHARAISHRRLVSCVNPSSS